MAISLSSIKRSGRPKPPMVMMYAVHGIGKTTFGASAPSSLSELSCQPEGLAVRNQRA